ncbi:acetylornithine deacetylase/succinyl-diaminopimelate desuccinylase-like protein [Bradyrhizobium sp. AZCC 1678]|uniref:M20/M25/M40 family metallo-hydrolase n=1 Tax=Bradyrhizobium sp. AZCC 1678 TaxID=3117030 RepID=UPI002FF3F4CB
MINKIAQILCELISIESISENSNLDIIAYIEKILASSGVSARCVLSSDGRKASLLATIGPADRPGLVLSAHTDVVPVEGQAWTMPPFAGVIRDQRIYGRGATDMKGFLAVVLANVPRLKEVASVAPVHLAFSYDEEVGCRGAPDLVRVLMQSVAPPALAIVGDGEKTAIAVALRAEVLPLVASSAVRPPIWRQLPLSDAPQAHRILEANENIGKVLLLPAGATS